MLDVGAEQLLLKVGQLFQGKGICMYPLSLDLGNYTFIEGSQVDTSPRTNLWFDYSSCYLYPCNFRKKLQLAS